MKRFISLILVLAMMLSLAACGSSESTGTPAASGSESAAAESAPATTNAGTAASSEAGKTESTAAPTVPTTEEPTSVQETTEPEPAVVTWDLTKEYTYDYQNIVLLESENVRISAYRLSYKKSDKGMRLSCSVNIENLTDHTLVAYPRKGNENYTKEIPAGESYKPYVTEVVYDWNGLIGETEECFQRNCRVTIMNGAETVDMIQFDWYVSEKEPFVNLIVGEKAIREAEIAADRTTAREWNGSEREIFDYNYDDDVVLAETEKLRITADRVRYVNEGAGAMRYSFYVKIENLTDTPYMTSIEGHGTYKLPPHETKQAIQICSANDWNGLIGGTEDCFLDTCRINVYNDGDYSGRNGIQDVVSFDLYASEVAPFRNIAVGEEAVKAAEEARLVAELDKLVDEGVSLYHAENALISLDILRTEFYDNYESQGRVYLVRYIATNRSEYNVYTQPELGSKAYEAGASWYDAVVIQCWKTEQDEPATFSVSAYNAVTQLTGELAIEVKVVSGEKSADVVLDFLDAGSMEDLKAAEAYQDLTTLEPLLVMDNEAFHVEVLTTCVIKTETGRFTKEQVEEYYGAFAAQYYDGSKYSANLVLSVTNLTLRPLYLFRGGNIIGPGETVYINDQMYNSYGSMEIQGTRYFSVEGYTDDTTFTPAAYMGYSYEWSFDPATREVGASGFTEKSNEVDENALSSVSVSYDYDIVVAETEYYTVKLVNMYGVKSKDGVWSVRVAFRVINTASFKYLLGEAWKAAAGWEPGGDWFKPGDASTEYAYFTCQDSENVSGPIFLNVWGWDWDGAHGTQLFKNTISATIQLSETDPIRPISGQ